MSAVSAKKRILKALEKKVEELTKKGLIEEAEKTKNFIKRIK
jgi:hypothetical protein